MTHPTRTLATLTAAAVLALTSCSTTPTDTDNTAGRDRNHQQPENTNPTPPTQDTEPAELDPATTDELYLTVIRDSLPAAYAALPDQQLISLATTICDGFDNGLTFTDVGMAALETGVPPEAAGTMMGAGVIAYCPEHEDKLP